jgi:hypothetical protein
MYPDQPGETSEYVTSSEPSSFVDGENARVEYNHLEESLGGVTTGSSSSISMGPPDALAASGHIGGGGGTQTNTEVDDVGPEFEGKTEMDGEDFSPPEREDSFGAIIDAPRAETDSFMVTSSDNPIAVGKVAQLSHEWHGFASQDAGRMN